jgi:hypothetical protein
VHKVNTTKIVELTWSSPKGKFVGASKNVSVELGRKPESTDLNERHLFDVEFCVFRRGRLPICIIRRGGSEAVIGAAGCTITKIGCTGFIRTRQYKRKSRVTGK